MARSPEQVAQDQEEERLKREAAIIESDRRCQAFIATALEDQRKWQAFLERRRKARRERKKT